MAKMSVDDKLGFDKFVTDEHESQDRKSVV